MAFRTGKVIIAKNIKLDKEYKDILTYNESQMLTLVQTNQVASTTNCSFLDINKNVIDTNFSYANALKCNYMAIENPTYSNKWFFAFIDKVQYINNNTTRIYYTIDVWSTWRDYITFTDTYVIREHVSDDTIGLHTVPENVETGDYIINSQKTDSNFNSLTCVVASTIDPYDFLSFYGGEYNGIASGPMYLRFDYIETTQGHLSLSEWLSSLSGDRINAVKCIFMAPTFLCPTTGGNENIIANSSSVHEHNITAIDITSLNGYTPKNNKLLTYPYIYTLLTNHQGSTAILKQEIWNKNNSNNRVLKVFACLTPGCSIRIIPLNYNGQPENYDEGINLGKFPQLNWETDQYTNWLTNNGVNIATNLLTSAGLTISGASTGNPIAVSSGIMSIANTLNEVKNHSLEPPQTHGNLNSGDVTTASLYNTFDLLNMTIKAEYAKIIDDYFTLRGYKVNSLKVPNFNTRPIFNYVQISSDSNIGYSNSNTYNVNSSDMDIINNIFRHGTTLWHNHANIGNYSLDNSI